MWTVSQPWNTMRSGIWSDEFTTAPKLAIVIHARVQLMLTDFNSEWPRGHGKSVLDRDACRVQRATFQICGPSRTIGFHMVGMDSSDPSLLFSWFAWAFGYRSRLTVLESCLLFRCCDPSPCSSRGGPCPSSTSITWVLVRNTESCPCSPSTTDSESSLLIRSPVYSCVHKGLQNTALIQRIPVCVCVCACSEWITGVQWGTDSYSL